jgi:hypothetical protein
MKFKALKPGNKLPRLPLPKLEQDRRCCSAARCDFKKAAVPPDGQKLELNNCYADGLKVRLNNCSACA